MFSVHLNIDTAHEPKPYNHHEEIGRFDAEKDAIKAAWYYIFKGGNVVTVADSHMCDVLVYTPPRD
jgi:hypothetical protein